MAAPWPCASCFARLPASVQPRCPWLLRRLHLTRRNDLAFARGSTSSAEDSSRPDRPRPGDVPIKNPAEGSAGFRTSGSRSNARRSDQSQQIRSIADLSIADLSIADLSVADLSVADLDAAETPVVAVPVALANQAAGGLVD